MALSLFSLVTAALILIAAFLLPEISRFIWFFLFFGFIFTPIQSFVNARLIGLVGQSVELPFVREATIILSGYRGVDIWFIPFPLGNYGAAAQRFREIELTGTRFTSIIKAEIFMVPIILFTNFIYGSYIWKLAPIPSNSYPYAQLLWRLSAYQQCLFYTSTMKSELEVAGQEVRWMPANLIENQWWFWRARLVDQEWLDSEGKRGQAGPWTPSQTFFTRFEEGGKEIPEHPPVQPNEGPSTARVELPQLVLPGPADGELIQTPRPPLRAEARGEVPAGFQYYFEVDTDPHYTSPWIQHSTDQPWFFRALKPKVIGIGAAFGLVSYTLLSLFGLPVLLIFGFVRALAAIPHTVITEIIGALLARYYFWKKYGKQQWLQYAPILAVGFACGMALMGMAAVAVALIQKSVSVLIF